MKKTIGIISLILITQINASPQGFTKVSSDGGVTLYKKWIKNGRTMYVQEIDLSKGANIKLLVGDINNEEVEYGDNKGTKYWLERQSIKNTWSNSIEKDENTECITNGEYFGKDGKLLSTLSYPIKIDGDIYDGSSNIYKKYQKVLNITYETVSMKKFKILNESFANDKDKVDKLSTNLSKNLNGDSAIVGLDTSLNYGGYKEAVKRKGRTFIGITDKNKDGINETILIFNSEKATQQESKNTLISFGAKSKNIMMLDGGGSSQLICNNKTLVRSSDGNRIVPQFIVTLKGENQTFSYEDKVNFVFDAIERKYTFYFPSGTKTEKTGNDFYRRYEVRGKYHFLYAYHQIVYYYIGSGWIKWDSVDNLYKSLKNK